MTATFNMLLRVPGSETRSSGERKRPCHARMYRVLLLCKATEHHRLSKSKKKSLSSAAVAASLPDTLSRTKHGCCVAAASLPSPPPALGPAARGWRWPETPNPGRSSPLLAPRPKLLSGPSLGPPVGPASALPFLFLASSHLLFARKAARTRPSFCATAVRCTARPAPRRRPCCPIEALLALPARSREPWTGHRVLQTTCPPARGSCALLESQSGKPQVQVPLSSDDRIVSGAARIPRLLADATTQSVRTRRHPHA